MNSVPCLSWYLLHYRYIYSFSLQALYRVSHKNVPASHKKVLKSGLTCTVSEYEVDFWSSGTFLWDKGTFFGTPNTHNTVIVWLLHYPWSCLHRHLMIPKIYMLFPPSSPDMWVLIDIPAPCGFLRVPRDFLPRLPSNGHVFHFPRHLQRRTQRRCGLPRHLLKPPASQRTKGHPVWHRRLNHSINQSINLWQLEQHSLL